MMDNNKTAKKELRLYNVLFPIWLILLIPTAWLVILPGNFIIDSIVLLLTMKFLNIVEKKKMYMHTILKVWIFGFLADIIGSGLLFVATFVFEYAVQGDELYLTLPAMLVSAVLIYIFNYFISFKGYDKKVRRKMAINFAIFTAPYTFLIPIAWIY